MSTILSRPDPRPKPRSVKPRKTHAIDKPIVAIDGDIVLCESGELHSLTDLPELIRSMPSSIVVCHHVGQLVRHLDELLSGVHPQWQFRCAPVEREVYAPNRRYRTTVRDTTVSFFGFQGKNKKAGHYHYPVSPQTFCLKTVNDIRRAVDADKRTVEQLMAWAMDLRAFLIEQDIKLSPTAGGIAAQLLRDKRFYPNARRKVPRHTNAAARDLLPGNFYRLYDAKINKVYRAAYLDQTNAHHMAATAITFPDANTLRRRGRYSTLKDKAFMRAGSPGFEDVISQHGLLYVKCDIPRILPGRFPLPCLMESGYRNVFLYSNELDYVRSLGVQIRSIIAAWTSPDADPGPGLYAKWAMECIAESDEGRKPWIKPTLLAFYGVLAARPKKVEFAYKQAVNSVEKQYPVGSGFLTVQARRMDKITEMITANVIHRGMIEAETRLRSLRMARELTEAGQSVLAVYADSVFVQGGELPLLSPPWRVQAHLTNLRFLSATAFKSTELTKTPGVSHRELDRARIPRRPSTRARNRDAVRRPN